MQLRNLEQVNHALQKYYAISRRRHGDDSAVDRMRPLLNALDKPHEKLRVIHVAGTSGKTSTCYFLAALLVASGKNVGLTVSPYIDTVLERVQLNGEPISEAEFCTNISEFMEIIAQVEETPGYFEVIIGFALWFYARKNVDYVVVETGIGGLYDSTNVIMREDKVCVITDIGMDHMQILGNTLQQIAAQKAGIMQPGNIVFMYEQAGEVMQVMRQYANKVGSHLRVVEHNSVILSDMALYQRRNWHLAYVVSSYVAERDGFELAAIDPAQVIIPGRMEVRRKPNDTILVFDGAHNVQKMQAFVASFLAQFPAMKADVLVAFKNDKAYEKVLSVLQPITSRLIVTSLHSDQNATSHGFHIDSISPQEVCVLARSMGMETVAVDATKAAYEKLLTADSKIKVVTGSLYLVGMTRAFERGRVHGE